MHKPVNDQRASYLIAAETSIYQKQVLSLDPMAASQERLKQNRATISPADDWNNARRVQEEFWSRQETCSEPSPKTVL